MSTALHCPVCDARFRGARICSRCGADLGPLMHLAVTAWRLREAARETLRHGDGDRARGLATEAQRVHSTSRGAFLRTLTEWMIAERARRARGSSDHERDLNRA
jgi:hypothetical protein